MIKARVISNDINHINQLKEHYQCVIKNKLKDLENISEEFVIVDDSIVTLPDVITIKTCPVPIFYIVNDYAVPNIDTGHVILIHAQDMIQQLRDYLADTVTCDNVISFYGTLSGIGTTNVAMSVAKEYAKQGKTCVLSLTFNAGLEYLNKPDNPLNGGLTQLLPHLVANTLTDKELLNAMIEHDGIAYLHGIKSLFELMDYNIEHIETLITTASRLYDHVIIDAGGGPCISRMALAAFRLAKYNNILVTAMPRSQTAWESIHKTVQCLAIDHSFHLIIAKYMRKTELMSERQIKRHYDMPYLGTIDEAIGLGIDAEMKRKPIAELSKQVNKQILALVSAID